jgi:hypothetical protein
MGGKLESMNPHTWSIWARRCGLQSQPEDAQKTTPKSSKISGIWREEVYLKLKDMLKTTAGFVFLITAHLDIARPHLRGSKLCGAPDLGLLAFASGQHLMWSCGFDVFEDLNQPRIARESLHETLYLVVKSRVSRGFFL